MKHLNRLIAFALLALISIPSLKAQCTVQLNYTDTIQTCINSELLINASAQGYEVIHYSDTFSTAGASSTIWANTPPGIYSNPCINYPSNPSPQAHFWTGNSVLRILETIPLDLTSSNSICFDFAAAMQSGLGSCEGPDINNEGVSLQYSNDNGTTWIDIIYLGPDGNMYPNRAAAGTSFSGSSIFNTWDNYCFSLPLAAQTLSTKIRWAQLYISSSTLDNWGIDNIAFKQTFPYTYYWNVTSADTASISYSVTGDALIDLVVANTLGDSCDAHFYIQTNPPSQTFVTDTFCFGSTYSLPSGSITSTPGTYIDTLLNTFACDSIITTVLVGEYQYSMVNDTFCLGDTYQLPGGNSVNTPGIYVDTVTVSSCKEIITTNLEVRNLCRTIIGRAFVDFNDNCIFDGIDIYVENKTIVATSTNNAYQNFETTDAFGNFEIHTDANAQEVSLTPFSPLYQANCFSAIQLANSPSLMDTINFPLKPIAWCDDLQIDIATNRLVNCNTSDYVVSYCNNGTLPVNNANIEVSFDNNILVDSASIPWNNVVGNTYSFPVGNVNQLDCASFIVHISVACDSTFLGQVLCAEAHIYPDTICPTDTSAWSGAELRATATCIGSDTVEFELKNVGSGDMTDWTKVVAIEDIIMIIQDSTKLNVNEFQTWRIPVTGMTQRIIADQPQLHPWATFTTDATMLCNTSGLVPPQLIVDTTFMAYPNDEESPYVAVDCQPIVGSYDPNDKTVYPFGVSQHHFITESTDLEYKIRFQNTGNDTAYTVVIIDTLSSLLDVQNLSPGASSHAYVYEVIAANVIRFTFNNINLLDSFTNEPLSHGFVQFKIEQATTNQSGDVINNTADIYFDSNPAITTNTVFNTIGGVILDTLIYKEPTGINESQNIYHANINVFPNPTSDYLVFDTEENMETIAIEVYTTTGSLVLKKTAQNTNKVVVDASKLASGTYLFNIQLNNYERANGRFIVK